MFNGGGTKLSKIASVISPGPTSAFSCRKTVGCSRKGKPSDGRSMKLKSGLSYWLWKDQLQCRYGQLDKPLATDVLIMGGGISGALIAHTLAKANIECVVVDKRLIGMGSTSASTSLLQYEIDIPLSQLIFKVGKANAERAYKLCELAVGKLEQIATDIHFKTFSGKQSLYFAASEKDISLLKEEFAWRKRLGLDVHYLDEGQIRSNYGLRSSGAILSSCAAATDAYLFTHSLFQNCRDKGVRVYDRTGIQKIDVSGGKVTATTHNGIKITAREVIYAVGYEGLKYINQDCGEVHTTYAISSTQGTGLPKAIQDTLFWNTAHPYLYMRSVNGHTVLIGGRDDKFYDSETMQQSLNGKSKQLADDFSHLFPDQNAFPACKWAGAFVTTRDGLPFIGRYSGLPHRYFALGFGGNGITFSIIAAEIIRDLILGRKNTAAPIFSFTRQ